VAVEERGMEENEPRRDILAGPPASWVPPGVSPPQILRRARTSRAHIPLERGGADASGLRACLLGGVSIEPTSREREQLVPGWLDVDEGESRLRR
jgi:hypothetical protein